MQFFVRKYRDNKKVTTNKQRMKFASEPNYHTTKQIPEDLLIMEMKKISVTMNKPIYLGQSILDISKTLMYEFWYGYIKPKYGKKAKLCYMDTDGFIIYIKLKISTKILLMMQINGLVQVIMIKMIIDHYPQEKIKK